jgi:hypothetical protein
MFSVFLQVLSYFLCLLGLLAEYLTRRPLDKQEYFVYLLTDADVAWLFVHVIFIITIPIK